MEYKSDKERAEEFLKDWFPKGSTAHTTVVHVARSGMSRHIKVFAISGERIQNVSYYVSKLLNWNFLEWIGKLKTKSLIN